MRKSLSMLSVLLTLACICAGCGGQKSQSGTLQFYTTGGDIVQQGLLSKDGWQLTFDHVYVTVAELTAYQTDPPYDPVYSADIVRYEISTVLDGSHTLDLKSGDGTRMLVGEATDVQPGAYNAVSWKMVPASAGDAAGYSLALHGTAEKEGQAINFGIQLDWEATFMCGDHFIAGADLKAQKGRLDAGGMADLEMNFAFDALFGDGTLHETSVLNRAALGFGPLAALAQGDVLDIDLSTLQAELSDDDYQAFGEALIEIAYTGSKLCYHLK